MQKKLEFGSDQREERQDDAQMTSGSNDPEVVQDWEAYVRSLEKDWLNKQHCLDCHE